MVGLSGGKDSWALIQILDVLRKRAPIDFSLVAVNVNSGYQDFRHDLVTEACAERGWECHVEHTTIGAVMDDILDDGDTPCSLCARGCGAACCTGWRRPSARRRSRSATTSTTSSRRRSLNLFFQGIAQGDARAARLGLAQAHRDPAARLRHRSRSAGVHAGVRAAGDRLLLSGLRRSRASNASASSGSSPSSRWSTPTSRTR